MPSHSPNSQPKYPMRHFSQLTNLFSFFLWVLQVRFSNLGFGFSLNYQLLTTNSQPLPLPLSPVDWRLSTLLEVHG